MLLALWKFGEARVRERRDGLAIRDEDGKGESAWKKKLRKLRRWRRDFVVDGGWAGDVLEDTDIDEED